MSRVAPKHRAPKPEPLAQPEGCFRCGIGGLLGWYDERWWCPDHFFAEPGKRWPKPRRLIALVPIEVDLDRVKHWLEEVKLFEAKCRKAGKNRTSDSAMAGISASDRDLSQAVECAIVEMLDGAPNLEVHPGSDPIDGILEDQTYDVKATVVHTSWSGPQGFNGTADDGRVGTDLMIAALVTRSIDRCEIVGYAERNDPRAKIRGFSRPAYARETLRNPIELIRRRNERRGNDERAKAR